METPVLYFSKTALSVIMWTSLSGLGLTILFLLTILALEVRNKKVW